MRYEEFTIEGRNAVLEAFRAGKTIDRLFILDGCKDGPVQTIVREARKGDTIITFVKKERLDQMSETGKHQGVIAYAAAYEYAQVEDMLALAREKGEDPFLFILDGIEDPHNLGSVIRVVECAGATAVVIPNRRSAVVNETVVRVSAGATNYVPVCKVNNINQAIEKLKQKGVWVFAADMDGEEMYNVNLKGDIALVIGAEGDGVGALTRKVCDGIISIPMSGKINSLNASVSAGIVLYEAVRQRGKN